MFPHGLERHLPCGWKRTPDQFHSKKIILFISCEEPKIAVEVEENGPFIQALHLIVVISRAVAKTRKWADQISHAISAVLLPQGSNYCLRVCYNTNNLKSLGTASSSDSHKPARDLSLLEGRDVLPRS